MITLVYNTHPISRLLLGLGLLFLSIMSQSMPLSAILLLLSMAMIRALDGHWLTIQRLLKLLRWFVIPILLLHALLSPGQLLIPGGFMPISREGLVQGLFLSLHLSAVFLMAMLMFRLLQRTEWLRYILLLPWLGQKLIVYAWMMASMKMDITALLSNLRMQFRLRRDWKKAPLLLMSAFRQTLADASEHAALLWLRWPAHMPALVSLSPQQVSPAALQYHVASVLSAGFGCAAFVFAWL